MSNSARDTATSTRWTATISYLNKYEEFSRPSTFSIGIEEVEELQEIIERIDDWNNIYGDITIKLTYNNGVKK